MHYFYCREEKLKYNPILNVNHEHLKLFYISIFSEMPVRLYGVTHMVKDHSDSERGNPLPPHRLLFPISSTDRIAHTTVFVIPVVEHWLEREIPQWVLPMKDRSNDPSHHERTLLPRSYISHRALVMFFSIYNN